MDNSLSIDSTNNVTLKYYSTKVDTDAQETGYMDFDGYLKTLAAQMSNQDFNNPMSDSEFMQQMASYRMMETISSMSKQSQISYATSMVGKAVTVSDGSTVDTGIVESVIIEDNKYYLLVNGDKYSTDSITDVVDPDVYNKLGTFIGQPAVVKTADGELSGNITNIIIRNGSGYAVINGGLYPVSDIISIGKQQEEEEAPAEEPAEEPEEAVQTANVNGSGASMNLPDDGVEFDMYYYGYDYNDGSQGTIILPDKTVVEPSDEVIAYLEREYLKSEQEAAAQKTNSASTSASTSANSVEEAFKMEMQVVSEVDTDGNGAVRVSATAANGSIFNNDEEEEGVLGTANVNGYTANGSYGYDENGKFTYITNTELGYSDEEELQMMKDNGITVVNETDYDTTVDYSKRRSGTIPVPGTSITGLKYYPAGEGGFVYGKNKYFTDNGIDTSNRAFSQDFPEEAAYANSVNTKMYDIRFINNRRVNSEINTDTIMGFTNAGKAFTDIGFSGKGRLGEVITWADGTQRVEIISESGSAWFTTTGNFTLDEICDFSADFNICSELTTFEKVIRDAAREYTSEELEAMDYYEQFYREQANNYLAE